MISGQFAGLRVRTTHPTGLADVGRVRAVQFADLS